MQLTHDHFFNLEVKLNYNFFKLHIGHTTGSSYVSYLSGDSFSSNLHIILIADLPDACIIFTLWKTVASSASNCASFYAVFQLTFSFQLLKMHATHFDYVCLFFYVKGFIFVGAFVYLKVGVGGSPSCVPGSSPSLCPYPHFPPKKEHLHSKHLLPPEH